MGEQRMPRPLEITYEHIESLNEQQFTDLLSKLLHLEALSEGISESSAEVSLKINVADGGEDGRIQWTDGPSHTGWIPSRFTLFQCKAANMPPASCKSEILKKDSTNLKTRVEEVLNAGGTYVLFYNRSCNAEQQVPRIQKFREAINLSGKHYANTADIRIYDANKIAKWANKYIPIVTSVLRHIGRDVSIDIETWTSWSRHNENQYTYISDQTIKGHIQGLRNHFLGVRKVARIVGRSGLGKSRLALEAFRPPEDSNDLVQKGLSDQIVYVDVAAGSYDLLTVVSTWRSSGLRGLLVVDNCPLELHLQLCNKIQHADSLLNLLTLDYNPEKVHVDYPFIELKPASTETVIKPMLRIAYPALQDEDINRIAIFAEGFPQMAVLLAEARLNDRTDIGNLENPVIIERLLWGRNDPDTEARSVISACAIFEQVGFSEDVMEQRRFVAEKICRMTPERFYEVASVFIERGILDKRGRFVSLTPIPLAIRLAAEWWKGCSPERALELITQQMPGNMAEALCDQISKLQFLSEARDLTKQLCGERGPFGKAEVLNTEKGARLFRSFSEVNPHAAAEAIDSAFGSWSIEELKNVKLGRRNLVWALEKLCFWEDTFYTSARVLLAFAAAENETWSNNATGQFLQLFHVFLSGTQTPAEKRLKIIDEALNRAEDEYIVIGLEALGAAIQTHSFSRMSGAELQGSLAPLHEWRPKEWSEVSSYWKESLIRLKPFVINHDKNGDIARKQVSNEIMGLIQHGIIDEVESIILAISKQNNLVWPDAIESIQILTRHDNEKIPSDVLARIHRWIDLLQPERLEDKLRLTISIPPYDHVEDEDGHYIDLAALRAKGLAIELIKRDSTWMEHLIIIFKGEQRQGFLFGSTLGEFLLEDEFFITKALDILRKISTEGNAVVLGGFLYSLRKRNPGRVTKTLQVIANCEELQLHLIDVTRLSQPESADLNQALSLAISGALPIASLRAFAYGGVLDHLSTQVIIDYCRVLSYHSNEGAWIALETLGLYTHRNKSRKEKCREAILEILLKPGLLMQSAGVSQSDIWHWKETVIKFLDDSNNGNKLAEHLVREIFAIQLKSDYQEALRLDYAPVIEELLVKHHEVIWPVLSNQLLSTNWKVRTRLRHLLGDELISFGDTHDNKIEGNVLFKLSDQILKNWCITHPKQAPKVIAGMMPLYNKSRECWIWHPFAKWLIDQFGANEEVLKEISSNMKSFGWSGSVIPHLEKQIEVLENVRDHSFANVRIWARKMVTSLRKEIERERLLDEEEEHGIYDS